MMDIEDIINWRKLSAFLGKNDRSIRKNDKRKRKDNTVNDLLNSINDWDKRRRGEDPAQRFTAEEVHDILSKHNR